MYNIWLLIILLRANQKSSSLHNRALSSKIPQGFPLCSKDCQTPSRGSSQYSCLPITWIISRHFGTSQGEMKNLWVCVCTTEGFIMSLQFFHIWHNENKSFSAAEILLKISSKQHLFLSGWIYASEREGVGEKGGGQDAIFFGYFGRERELHWEHTNVCLEMCTCPETWNLKDASFLVSKATFLKHLA